MAKNSKLVLLRLQKQEARLHSEPLEQAWVAREGVLNFHFCLHGMDGAYEGGYYHGVLELSEEYPFAPPQLQFFTPSGRFQVNKPICTTFTNFHKQSWASSWNVRTMILATISFMNSEDTGAGYINSSYYTRRQYAKASLQHNIRNPQFRQLFKKYLNHKQIAQARESTLVQSTTVQSEESADRIQKQSFALYGLYVLLGILVLSWLVWRGN